MCPLGVKHGGDCNLGVVVDVLVPLPILFVEDGRNNTVLFDFVCSRCSLLCMCSRPRLQIICPGLDRVRMALIFFTISDLDALLSSPVRCPRTCRAWEAVCNCTIELHSYRSGKQINKLTVTMVHLNPTQLWSYMY